MKKILIGVLVSIGFAGISFAGNWNLPGVTIVSREERGADDAIRFAKTSYTQRKEWLANKTAEEMKRLEETNLDEYFDKQQEQYVAAMRNEYLVTKYPDEQTVDSQIFEYNDHYLKWPQSYHFKKTKVIIHHTAGDTSYFTGKQSVIAYLQDIYKYHTITRGWGDIGYHFLIDPYGNIYEGRAGGEGVIAAHTSRNNSAAIGVSLMGNFDKQELTKEQLKSLISLLTILAKKYNIDPNLKTTYYKAITEEPYMKTVENYSFAGHKDAGVTSCPGANVYKLLPEIRQTVISNLAKGVLVGYTNTLNSVPSVQAILSGIGTIKNIEVLKNRKPDFTKIVETLRKTYLASHKDTILAKVSSQKIKNKITTKEAKSLMSGNISVLLYDLSTAFTKWDVSCAGKCIFVADEKSYVAISGSIELAEGGVLLTLPTEKHIVSSVSVMGKNNNPVVVTNYKRTSVAKIARNSFYGKLLFTKDKIKNLTSKKIESQYVVINTLSFKNYLRGIVETNDKEHEEKIKVMNLISKSYALFYLNGINHHASIPEGSTYNAIDNPDMFQKYVGAGLDKTLKKVPTLVKKMENQILVYSGYVPILPYFSCSAGFTRSGKEKRGWEDTPYLQGRIDFEKCDDFSGHGVGLSGRGAQYLAQQGWTYKQILQYYYPGIQVVDL